MTIMTLFVLLLNLAFTPTAFASSNSEKEAKFTKKVKANIVKLGTGEDAKVEIKLKDKTKLNGYVSEINASQFTIMNNKTGQPVTVLYSNVKQIKGNNLSTGATILIGIGVLILVIIIVGSALKT